MQQNKDGFSILEIIIAMAMLSVIASLAMSSYKEYLIKARAMDLTNIAMHVQMKLLQQHIDNPNWKNIEDLGIIQPLSSKYVNKVVASPNGIGSCTVTEGTLVGGVLVQGNLTNLSLPNSLDLVKVGCDQQGFLSWKCGTTEATIAAKNEIYLPAECRQIIAVK